MLQKDKYKALIALALILTIAICYYFLGKEGTKYIALGAFGVWLGSIYFLGRR